MYFEIWYEWREQLPPKQWAAQWRCRVPLARTPEEAGAVVTELLRTERAFHVHVRACCETAAELTQWQRMRNQQ